MTAADVCVRLTAICVVFACLQTLNLQFNRLNGTLPSSWGNLTALNFARLQGNPLQG
jgi:hypothetical protein